MTAPPKGSVAIDSDTGMENIDDFWGVSTSSTANNANANEQGGEGEGELTKEEKRERAKKVRHVASPLYGLLRSLGDDNDDDDDDDDMRGKLHYRYILCRLGTFASVSIL